MKKKPTGVVFCLCSSGIYKGVAAILKAPFLFFVFFFHRTFRRVVRRFSPFLFVLLSFHRGGRGLSVGRAGLTTNQKVAKENGIRIAKELEKKNQNKTRTFGPARLVAFHVLASFFFSFSSLGTRMGSVGQQRTNKPKSNKKTKIRVSLRKGRVVGFAFGSSSSLADFVRFVFRFFVSPLCACSCV